MFTLTVRSWADPDIMLDLESKRGLYIGTMKKNGIIFLRRLNNGMG